MVTGLSYITLYTENLPQALAFYRDAFGFKVKQQSLNNDNSDHDWVFFDLEGIRLALYPQLLKTAQVGQHTHANSSNTSSNPSPNSDSLDASYSPKLSLSYNVASRAEVDRLMQRLQAAGASITRAANTQPWGTYGGFLQDSDGHLWEIVWSPSRDPVD